MPHFSGLPFEDIRNLIRELPARESPALLALENLAPWFYTHSGKKNLAKPFLIWFGTAHAQTPVTGLAREMLNALSDGTNPINKRCAGLDIGLKAFDLGIDFPALTLSEPECAATIAYGMEALAGEPDLILLNSFCEAPPAPPFDSLDALALSGRRDIAALFGAMLAARLQNVPVFFAGAAAKNAYHLLEKLKPQSGNHALNAAHFFEIHTHESEACFAATALLRISLL